MGHQERHQAFIVNYADDLVRGCRGRANETLAAMRAMMTQLKLTVNESKTRVWKVPKERFDFPGYTLGRATHQVRTASRVQKRIRVHTLIMDDDAGVCTQNPIGSEASFDGDNRGLGLIVEVDAQVRIDLAADQRQHHDDKQ